MANCEINIHGATPTVHLSGETLWITIPLTDDDGGPDVTAFISPDVAKRIGQDLLDKAELADQIVELNRKGSSR